MHPPRIATRLSRLLVPVFVLVLGTACERREDAPPSPSPSTSTSASPSSKPSATTAAAPVDACKRAQDDLDAFIATLDRSCTKDADCGGFFLRDDVCKGPTMLRNPGCPPAQKPLLFGHQGDVRSSCDAGPACSPAAYKAVCKNGTCVDALAAR